MYKTNKTQKIGSDKFSNNGDMVAIANIYRK